MQMLHQNIWLLDKLGNYKEFNIPHDLSLDFATNSIRFRIKADGFLYGYIVGSFNDWQKEEHLKLEWNTDSDDGSLWLTKEILNIENLVVGTNQYTFVLIDLHGNEFKVSINDKDFIPLSFNWLTHNNKLEIKASQKHITVGFELELIAIIKSLTGFQEIIPVEWSISKNIHNLKIIDDKLLIENDIESLEKIEISCIAKNDPNIRATRIFEVKNTVRNGCLVNFIKKDKQYSGDNFSWELWNFNNKKYSKAIPLSEENDFGLYAICQKKHLIARKRQWGVNWQNEWAEQTIGFKIPKKNHNYYIVHGDSKIYKSLTDVINRTNPKIKYAVMNDATKIIAHISDKPLVGTRFELWIDSEKVQDISVLIKHKHRQLIFTNLPSDIDPSKLIEIRANNTFLPAKVLMGNYLDNFYYPKDDMGVVFNQTNISLRIWAPTATKVEVLLYNQDLPNSRKAPDFLYKLNAEKDFGSHHIDITRNEFEGKYYLYRLYFDDLDPRGNKIITKTYAIDPYATGLGINGRIGFLVDLNSPELIPDKWQEYKSSNVGNKDDAIIYETHLRDFTISSESNITKELKGKFLGAVENDAYYAADNNKVSVGIDSLVELGITHIHLLPIFDFSSVDEEKINDSNNRNWGYDPENYNAPDGSYSIDPADPLQRIKGVRQMVSGFHDKGIGVIMDMVYNHMTETSNLDKIVPKYYFRTDHLGNFTNGSGCGNELATEQPMVSKFIQDSVIHWIKDYNIDGLRFDLMELIDLDTIKKIIAKVKKIDPNILIYGEPWKGGDSPLTNGTYKGTQRNQDFGVFNDTFRDAIRGNNAPENGFVNGKPHSATTAGRVMEGLRGSIHDLTAKPTESINYVDAHDNYTLWDHIEKSQNHSIKSGDYRKHIPANIFESRRVRQNSLALGLVLTAQGIPFIHGGVEFLRTKQGDHNSYQSNDKVNAFHWSDKLTYKAFFDYTAGLIKLRKEHPAFRMKDADMIKKHLNITTAHHDGRSGVIISHFKNHANEDSWQDIIVIYNATSIDGYDVNALLPVPSNGSWNMVVNHEKAGADTIANFANGKLPALRSYSMMIAHS